MQQPSPKQRDDDEETESERRITNISLIVAAVVIVGGGIWLVNAMIDSRKAEECLESGRRNCHPISVAPTQRER